jgi:hypothetical protein
METLPIRITWKILRCMSSSGVENRESCEGMEARECNIADNVNRHMIRHKIVDSMHQLHYFQQSSSIENICDRCQSSG